MRFFRRRFTDAVTSRAHERSRVVLRYVGNRQRRLTFRVLLEKRQKNNNANGVRNCQRRIFLNISKETTDIYQC